jgi:HEAT repeat protein
MNDVFESFADLDALVDELRSDDAERRRIAIIELGDSGETGAVLLLAGLSNDPDAGVRRQVAIALGSFDGSETAAALGQ